MIGLLDNFFSYSEKKNFDSVYQEIFYKLIFLLEKNQTLHVGSNLSVLNVLSSYYFLLSKNSNKNNSELYLSKGQAGSALITVLSHFNLIEKNVYETFTQNETLFSPALYSYSPNQKLNIKSGALANTFGFVLGKAALNSDKRFYVVIGDSEFKSGLIWEGLLLLIDQNIKNVTLIIDCNTFGASGKNCLTINKFSKVIKNMDLSSSIIDGHSFFQLKSIFEASSDSSNVIFAKTIYAKGLKDFENDNSLRYHPL